MSQLLYCCGKGPRYPLNLMGPISNLIVIENIKNVCLARSRTIFLWSSKGVLCSKVNGHFPWKQKT